VCGLNCLSGMYVDITKVVHGYPGRIDSLCEGGEDTQWQNHFPSSQGTVLSDAHGDVVVVFWSRRVPQAIGSEAPSALAITNNAG
jgi:hypothetical protein